MSPRVALIAIAVCLELAGCGGGSAKSGAQALGTLVDGDATADAVIEDAQPGAGVGVAVLAPELEQRGPVTFSLTSNAGGAFAIDTSTGRVMLAGNVDYEAAAQHTIRARATSADTMYFAERDFVIAVTDSPAPTVEIDFPFAHASYAHGTVGVSGRVSHPENASTTVTAQAGQTSMQGAVTPTGRFFVKDIPVGPGDAVTLQVTAAHAGKDSSTTSMVLDRAPDIATVSAVILDAARNRFLYADRYHGTIVAVERGTYRRSLVSGAGRGSGRTFGEPFDLALDTGNDRLYVVDLDLDAVFRVDPQSGDRTVVSGGGILSTGAGAGTTLLDPVAVVHESTTDTLLVADDGRNSLVAINPTTGDRLTRSDNSGAFGATINFWTSLGLDTPRSRVIAVSGNTSEIFSIDLASGMRSLLSDRSDEVVAETSRFFHGISMAESYGVAYLADEHSNAVVRLDLQTGARATISSSGLGGPLPQPARGTGPLLEWPMDVVFDEGQNRLFVVEDDFADPLIEVHENGGDRELLMDGRIGAGAYFRDPAGIRLDAAARTAYIVDNIADIVVTVDLTSGSRRLIAGPPSGRGTIDTDPLALALDEVANVVYVVDFTTNALYALDVATGAKSVVSDRTKGAGVQLDNPVDVALDAASGMAYVLDRGLRALLTVELVSGNRTVLAGGFGTPEGLALDLVTRHAFVSDSSDDSIVRVDLTTSARTIVSSRTVATGPRLGDVGGVSLDQTHDRLLVIDEFPSRLVAVDLQTGNRTVVSGPDAGGVMVGGGPDLEQPRTIEVDEARQIAFVTDNLHDAVIAVDLLSGFRQIVAR